MFVNRMKYRSERYQVRRLIPLGDLEKRASELNKNSEIIVHCKSGGRSSKAVEYLRKSGFTNVKNLDRRDPRLER